MTNAEVFQSFASGNAAEGGSVRSVVVGTTAVLYSYGTPIALHPGDEFVTYFDARKYSVTTSKQANQAKRECAHVRNLDHETFRSVCRGLGVYLGAAR